MGPEEQLRRLSRIWPSSKHGFVFLPWIPQAQARTKARKNSWQEDRAFAWPKDKPAILEHLKEHWDDELYFTPMVFSKPYRRVEYASLGSRLWADLDEVDPREIEDYYRPTHAWETSPGRYAAVWCLSSERDKVTAPGHENHKLTYWLQADLSGWDTTQLLRVPGSANNKAHYKKGTRGSIVWWNRELHGWDKFDQLPEVEVPDIPEDLNEQLLESIDRQEVWRKARLRVSPLIRGYMRMRQTDGYDRSDVAWQIERELADAGCTVAEIVSIIRESIWNKFVGRQDELKRLITEASKAIAERSDDILEVEKITRPDMVPFWEDREYLEAPEPEWLVEGMIPKGGCGFIGGIPKSMKSWLGLDLAIASSTGEPWLECKIEKPVNVLYIQEEDPISLVRWRHHVIASSKRSDWALLDDEGALRDKIKAYPGMMYSLVYKGFRANDERWQTWLLDTVTEYKIDLVIMDTLATISPGVDMNTEVKDKVLDPIKDVARQTGATVAIIHHMRKDQSGSTRAGQNMAGSQQIHAWADWGVYVKDKNEKLGTLSFDHETKYTGTETMTYLINELHEGRWFPIKQAEEQGGPNEPPKERGPSRADTAKLRELIPTDAAAAQYDPLGQDLEVSAATKLRRAALMRYIVDDKSLGRVSSLTGLSQPAILKYASYLAKDYDQAKNWLHKYE